MENLYCWKCDQVVSMLNEEEWQEIEPLLNLGFRSVKQYRGDASAQLSDVPLDECYSAALKVYHSFPDVVPVKPDSLRHHRRSLFGAVCQSCRKPLRTPRQLNVMNADIRMCYGLTRRCSGRASRAAERHSVRLTG